MQNGISNWNHSRIFVSFFLFFFLGMVFGQSIVTPAMPWASEMKILRTKRNQPKTFLSWNYFPRTHNVCWSIYVRYSSSSSISFRKSEPLDDWTGVIEEFLFAFRHHILYWDFKSLNCCLYCAFVFVRMDFFFFSTILDLIRRGWLLV